MPDDYTQEEYDIKTTEPVGYAAASTNTTLKCRIQQLPNGSLTGIPALLLNEGTRLNKAVIVLSVKVLKDAPDFRAAAEESRK
jgi:predicted ATP-grasp superfamily ATP-dependent carboligase